MTDRRGGSKKTAFLLILLATLALVLAWAGPAAADEAPAKAAVSIALTTAVQPDGAVMLMAKVTKAAGGVVSNQPVDFYVMTSYFGERPLFISTATTDTAGQAAVRYQPSWSGKQQFSASYEGSAALAAGESSAVMDLKVNLKPYRNAPPEMAEVRRTTGLGALGLALAVWLVMLAVLLRVGLGVATAEAEPVAQPGTAVASTGRQ
jgi:hypothetical protein